MNTPWIRESNVGKNNTAMIKRRLQNNESNEGRKRRQNYEVQQTSEGINFHSKQPSTLLERLRVCSLHRVPAMFVCYNLYVWIRLVLYVCFSPSWSDLGHPFVHNLYNWGSSDFLSSLSTIRSHFFSRSPLFIAVSCQKQLTQGKSSYTKKERVLRRKS